MAADAALRSVRERALERRDWAEAHLPAGDRARYFLAESASDLLALADRVERLQAALERISKGSLLPPCTPPRDAVIALTVVGLMADEALIAEAEATDGR